MRGAKFKVRVVTSKDRDSVLTKEIWHENLNWSSAIELFRFYIDATLEFNLGVYCVNIFSGKRCLKMFSNHSYK